MCFGPWPLTLLSSYELPHEAFKSHVYPRQASNGSTVIIYGHEQGLRLVWYGGKAFKPPKKAAPAPKVNGTAKNDPMIVDLDDDDEPAVAETSASPAEFEEEEDEIDPSAPYRDVRRYIDIPLGTAAARIAVPHITQDLAQAPPESWPALYLDRIVIAVACEDLTIRVISAPIDPPALEVQDVSKLDVQTVKIFGPNSHQQFISDIAITHTTGVSTEPGDREAQIQAKPQTRSQSKQDIADSEGPRWSLLLASISCSGAGLLLVHQIPVQSNNHISTDPEHFLPIRRQYLRCSSMGAKLAFNPSPYPVERHSSVLITLPEASCVKLYQIFPVYNRERRGSAATADSASSIRSARVLTSERGKFLMTFLPPFVPETSAHNSKRKRVLDARWIIGGRAVIALLEDGEWGIWDLEAVGPTSSGTGSNLIRGQGNISGIHGGSLTRFATRSSFFPSAETKQKSTTQTQPASGSLAPMTPSTRKSRSDGLFQGSKVDAETLRASGQQSGTIYVEERPSARLSRDESVILSYSAENIYLPSVLSFWKGESKPLRLPHVKLGGQIPRSVNLFPMPVSSSPSGGSGLFDTVTSPPDFLIQTPHRIILSLNPVSPQSSSAGMSNQTVPSQFADQALLASGALDVDGMDRILDDMGASKKPMNLFTKSVGFRIDDEDADGDVNMASPTPAKYKGLKIANSGKRGPTFQESPVPQRRIFS